MLYDSLIKGGEVVDPGAGLSGRLDVAIKDGRIAAVDRDIPAESARSVVDATGKYVTPGLVDLHTHCYWGATFWGIEADPVAARTGVTTWVDAGSAGAYNFHGFRRYAVEASQVRMFSILNLSYIGLAGPTYEMSNPDYLDVPLALKMIERNRDLIVGIKARMDSSSTRGVGLESLRLARILADQAGLPLMVHLGVGPPSLSEIVAPLKRGDILTHCFPPHENRIVDADQNLIDCARDAWDRGVIFDIGHGAGAFSYPVAEAMLAAGRLPDVISTDIHQYSVQGPMYDLPTVISKFLNLGMSLADAIERATAAPARVIGHPELGTLRQGSAGDVAIFALERGDYTFHDVRMIPRRGTMRLVNTHTIVGGKLMEKQPERPVEWWAKR